MSFSFFSNRRKPARDAARALYVLAGEAALQPPFFGLGKVPDTLMGRFELTSVYLILIMRRLQQLGAPGQDLAQLVFGIAFKEFDAALREEGVGDLSVGKHIRKLGELFYGRAALYDTAIKAASLDDLAAALGKHAAPAGDPAFLMALAQHVLAVSAALQSEDFAGFFASRVCLPAAQLPN